VAVLERIVGEHVAAISPRTVPLRVNPTVVRIGEHLSFQKAESPLDVSG
jgi:hypothetical protein